MAISTLITEKTWTKSIIVRWSYQLIWSTKSLNSIMIAVKEFEYEKQ